MTLKRLALFGFLVAFLQSILSVTAEEFNIATQRRMLVDKATLDNANTAIGLAKSCYNAFISNIPPSFCYKKGGDFGKIPTACSSGYFRYLALCYKNCDSGYKFVLGVCWQKCGSGYSDHGLTCYKNLFKWHFKKSYVPSSYTNFDSRASCDSGMYKSGALCYRDCNKIGLLNCGIGACSATSQACGTTIASMAVDALLAIGQTALLVASFGSSSAATTTAKTGVEQGFKKLGSLSLKQSLNAFKTVISKQGKSAFLKQVGEYAFKNIGKFVVKKIAKEVVSKVCDEIGSKLFDKVEKSSEPILNFQDFDLNKSFGNTLDKLAGPCKDTSTSNNEINCAKSVLDKVAIVDPTGFVALASSVLQPVCDV